MYVDQPRGNAETARRRVSSQSIMADPRHVPASWLACPGVICSSLGSVCCASMLLLPEMRDPIATAAVVTPALLVAATLWMLGASYGGVAFCRSRRNVIVPQLAVAGIFLGC